jgi:serpin B
MRWDITIFLFSLLLSSVALSGCLSEERDQLLSGVRTPANEADQTINGCNLFALDLYRELADENENVFISPWSLNAALSMTYEGARDKTAVEMKSVLHLAENDSDRRRSFSEIDKRISADDPNYIFATASSLWADRDLQILPEYSELAENFYHARASNVDFRQASENARMTINSWVKERTHNKIIELIPSGYIDSMTRLVLANAVYFNATWAKQFDRENTRDEDFTTETGETVKVPMMKRIDEGARFKYMKTDEVEMLQMPFRGERLSMTVILPKKQEIGSINGLLTQENIRRWEKSLLEQRVDVYLPKFKIKSSYFLKDCLADLGMPAAFEESSNFTGISTAVGLYLTEVIHQAYIDVNEEGAEASAATAAMIGETASMNAEKASVFRADHAFLFTIEDRETGCMLFV